MGMWDWVPDWWNNGRSVRTGGPAALSGSRRSTSSSSSDQKWNYTSPSAGLGNPAYNSNYTAYAEADRVTTPPEDDQGGGRTRGPSRPSGPSAAQLAAQRAAAEAAAAMTRAGNRFRDQAANLDPQIAALKYALETSFKQSLDQNLGDIDKLLDEQFDMLKDQAGERGRDFLVAARNSEKAAAGQADTSISNLVRERQEAMTSVLTQGAGQTDTLRALVSAARNWHQNAQEGNRAYFDSLQSINQGITDLNLDTETALANVHTQGESERERLWQDYYNRRSETFTQLGNLYQQQADYLDMAKEQKVGEGGGGKKTASGEAFMDASKEAGKSYVKQGLPDWIKQWKGTERVDARVSNTNLAAAPRFERPKRAQGATLRRWAA